MVLTTGLTGLSALLRCFYCFGHFRFPAVLLERDAHNPFPLFRSKDNGGSEKARAVMCPRVHMRWESQSSNAGLSVSQLFPSTLLSCLLNTHRLPTSLETCVKYMSFSSFETCLVLSKGHKGTPASINLKAKDTTFRVLSGRAYQAAGT